MQLYDSSHMIYTPKLKYVYGDQTLIHETAVVVIKKFNVHGYPKRDYGIQIIINSSRDCLMDIKSSRADYDWYFGGGCVYPLIGFTRDLMYYGKGGYPIFCLKVKRINSWIRRHSRFYKMR